MRGTLLPGLGVLIAAIVYAWTALRTFAFLGLGAHFVVSLAITAGLAVVATQLVRGRSDVAAGFGVAAAAYVVLMLLIVKDGATSAYLAVDLAMTTGFALAARPSGALRPALGLAAAAALGYVVLSLLDGSTLYVVAFLVASAGFGLAALRLGATGARPGSVAA